MHEEDFSISGVRTDDGKVKLVCDCEWAIVVMEDEADNAASDHLDTHYGRE